MTELVERARIASLRLNRWVDRLCVLLLVLLVLDVWLGVLVRYVVPLPLTFTEEAARYLMIWMALLAISSGIVHREHIGVEFLFDRFPAKARRALAVSFDVISFVFFFLLFWYGLTFAEKGFSRLTMIYAMPKGYAFASVPAAAALACIQLALVGFVDLFAQRAPDHAAAEVVGEGLD